jgi:hypothetical protein
MIEELRPGSWSSGCLIPWLVVLRPDRMELLSPVRSVLRALDEGRKGI